jgi:hypothetical protein
MTAGAGQATPFKPPAAARESFQGRYAGFASRFAAFVADLIVLTGIFMLILAAINFAASILTGKSIDFNRNDTWVVIAYLAWGFIYFAHFLGPERQDRWRGAVRPAGPDRRRRRRQRAPGDRAHAGVPIELSDPGAGVPGHPARRPAPGAARCHRRHGGGLLVGCAGGTAAIPVPQLVRGHPARPGRPAHPAPAGSPQWIRAKRRALPWW